MIVSNSILYSRVLTPYGKYVKEPTVLGAALIGPGAAAAVYAILVVFAVL